MSPVQDVGEAEFEAAVVARSRQVPVVVDFWAEWCAPCRALGPTLEREVAALNGRVELKKVDIDDAQSLAGRFKVQSIPAVMAFRDGKVVASFVGARDATFLRRWLAELAPSHAQAVLGRATTEGELRALIDDPEVGPAASYQLAERLLGLGQVEEALGLLDRVKPGNPLFEKAEAAKRQAAFAFDAQAFGGEARAREVLSSKPDDLEARFALASALAARGDFAGALDTFLGIVAANRKFREDAARKAMVAIFDRLGPPHELTQQFRRRLQIVL